MSTLLHDINRAIQGRSPVIYLFTPEEDRILALIREIAAKQGDAGVPVHEWSCVDGFADVATDTDTRDPVVALQTIADDHERAFFVMKDLSGHMDRPEVLRSIRDVYYNHKGEASRILFIVSPDLVIPDGLQKEVHLIDCPTPDEIELTEAVVWALRDHDEIQLSDEDRKAVVLALKGMTLSEAWHVMNRVIQMELTDRDAMLDEILAEKKMIVRRSGYLEFSPPRSTIDDIGGLDNMKEWLVQRKKLFSQDALDAGIPAPKGLLIMGISGCGKSLAIKAISTLWGVPLFRLDMNLVFSGMYGTAEAAFHKALQTVESVAPAILWIDEIENALGLEEGGGMGIDSHIFSSFLTWMQEKPPLVFIAATANKIHALPAEIIRKGRFDQVFFVDLPNRQEVDDILRINLIKHEADLTGFDFKMLVIMMEGWNGAEIEQAVVSARTRAYYEDRKFNMSDLTAVIQSIVPLSQTMEQQIKAIRDWAFYRATPASKYSRIGRRR